MQSISVLEKIRIPHKAVVPSSIFGVSKPGELRDVLPENASGVSKPKGPVTRLLLVVIFICGLLLRLGALTNPVDYDEAYTIVEFASKSWWAAISDYSLPNNHIFHTLLVRESLLTFGLHAWSSRLPALLAGLGTIIVVYFLGKALYSKESGIVAAALVAFLPEMIRYSISARGYSLVGLFCLLLLWLAHKVVRQPSARIWGLMAICSALGLWTIPLMFYPAGAVYLWIILEGPRQRRYFIGWLGSGLLTGVLTILLYSPALLVSGWRKVLDNGFVQPVGNEKYFGWLLSTRLTETLNSWTDQVPVFLIILLGIGFLLSVILCKKIESVRWPMPAVLFVWCTILVLVRRPEVFDRFWSWLVAPMLVWSAGGLVETARLIRKNGLSYLPALLTGLSIVGLVGTTAFSLPGISQNWSKVSNPQASANYLKTQLQSGDCLLAGYPNNVPLWYYLLEAGVSRETWQARRNANRYIILLATNQKNQSVENVIKSYHLDPLDIDLRTPVLMAEYGKIKIISYNQLK